MDKKELLKHIGSVSQIGGVRDLLLNDGPAKGVRAIEVDTGVIRFTLLPDRGMDIAQTSCRGEAVSWISAAGITDPRFYEKDGDQFLRGFFGGLVTTCGLKNIGRAYEDMGLHDRISNTPAENVSIFADWVGEEYVMKVSGSVRQSKVFGENLVLKRTVTTGLFSSSFTLCDSICNEGFRDETVALAYHCNFGFPLVSENARIIGVPEAVGGIHGPIHGKKEECIPVGQAGEYGRVGIQNGQRAAYITYSRDTLPKFLLWKMLSEGEYVVGLEPRTTNFGGENIETHGEYVVLKPFEELKTYLKFEFESPAEGRIL